MGLLPISMRKNGMGHAEVHGVSIGTVKGTDKIRMYGRDWTGREHETGIHGDGQTGTQSEG